MRPEPQKKEFWKRVDDLFHAALELEPGQRAGFLAEACAGDQALRDEVESLLAHDKNAKSFIEVPAVEIAPKIPDDGQPDLLEGQLIDRYEIKKELGKGGMGVVYLAYDTKLKRQVALKLLPEHFTTNIDRVRRFQQEAFTVSRLNHKNIVTIYDIGQTERLHYTVTEFVEGQTLRERIKGTPMSLDELLKVIRHVASALKAAHESGIIHRDIKPENIMIRSDGLVKVLDFGIAKLVEQSNSDPEATTQFLTHPAIRPGTPEYMPPEQRMGKSVDRRSDLFSLGVVLYECLTSRRPFLSGHVDPPSKLNPNVPADLDRITLKLLAQEPEARYQSADELLTDLGTARDIIRDRGRVLPKPEPPRFITWVINVLTAFLEGLRRPRYFIPAILVMFSAALLLFWMGLHWPPEPLLEAKHLYERGAAALHEGTFYRASKMLQEAVKIDDKYALAHARLAEAWNELDDTERAKDEIMSAHALVHQQSSPLQFLLPSNDHLYIDAIDATIRRDFTKAIEIYNEIASLSPDSPYVYADLGRAYEKKEDIDKAIENYLKATNLNQHYAAAFLRLGILYGSRKQDTAAALDRFDRAEQLYQMLGDPEGITEVLCQRGALFKQISKLTEAREQLQKALVMTRTSTYNKYQQIRSLLQLSGVSYSEGKTAEAKQYATEALALAQANGMENLATQGLIDFGNTLLMNRDYSGAEPYFKTALEIAQKRKARNNEARAMLMLGSLYIQQEKPDDGLPYIEQALKYYQQGSYGKEISQCLIKYGRAQLLRGNYDDALKVFDQQLQLAKQVDDPGQIARSQEEIGFALKLQELYPQAFRRFDESYKIYKTLDNPFHEGYNLLNRADMLSQLGRYDEARADLAQMPLIIERLDGDNKYRFLWSIWVNIIDARMDLCEQRFPQAKLKTQKALDLVSNLSKIEDTIAIAKSTLGLAHSLSDATLYGKKLCEDAFAIAMQSGEPRTISTVRLALAEAMLKNGDHEEALTVALQAQQSFAQARRQESEWRAWLIAGTASQRLGNYEAMREQLSRANKLLLNLQEKWGPEDFSSYLMRGDVRLYNEQLDVALASK